MIKAALVGATGYTGEELLHILSTHPDVEIVSLSALVEKPQDIAEIFPRFKGRLGIICKNLDIEEVKKASVIFLALPHTVSMKFVPEFIKAGKMVIDLSADYRLPASLYAKWYGAGHVDEKNLKNAVYGLPELYRDKIKCCKFVANPGCYPTSVVLGIAPLIKSHTVKLDNIIADSKSGITGAGRKAALDLLFAELAGNFKAYKIGCHQHAPEIDQQLTLLAGRDAKVFFAPHVLPIRRGLLSTIYLETAKKISQKEIDSLYSNFYEKEPFVRFLGSRTFPEIKNVVFTNFCDISAKLIGDKIVVVSALDNLTKGAAGQAVQNMNLMCGLDETKGLL